MIEHPRCRLTVSRDEETCLGHYCLAGNGRRIEPCEGFNRPVVISVAAVQECNKGAGIEQNAGFHRPKSSKYFLLVERSGGPSKMPHRSCNASCSEPGRGFNCRFFFTGRAGSFSSTRRRPSSTRSLSLRPRRAA